MAKVNLKFETATVPGFRAWLALALAITGLRASTVSLGIGASANLVGVFQRETGRDITLTKAAKIERFLHQAAAEKQVKLPTILEAAETMGVVDV